MEIDTQYMNDMLKYREHILHINFDKIHLTNDFNDKNYLYKPSGDCDCKEEMELINFDSSKSRDKFRVRVFRKGTLALYDELPNLYLCERWIEQLTEDNFDFDDYDITQGTLIENGFYWW